MPDRYNMLEHIASFPDLILQAQETGSTIQLSGEIRSVVVCGQPNSAGLLLKSVLCDSFVPVAVSQEIPKWVDDHTLVFVISHQEDGDDTVEIFAEAQKRKAGAILITSGGKAEFFAREKGKTFIRVPRRLVARNSVVDVVFAMYNVLENARMVPPKQDILGIANVLRQSEWTSSAKDLAQKMIGKIPLIITSDRLEGVGRQWVEVLSQNAKVHAFYGLVSDPHFIEGFASPQARYQVILIQDEADSARSKKQVLAQKRLIEEKSGQVTAIRLKGQSQLSKVLSAVHLGNLASYALAQLYDVDPTPTLQSQTVVYGSH